MRELRYADRWAAGVQLSHLLEPFRSTHPLVLALPRGGVPVGAAVAEQIEADLDVLVVRKLGLPNQPELGFGALCEDGEAVVDPVVVRLAGLTPADLEAVEEAERAEVLRRVHVFRGSRPLSEVAGRTVIIVDDGIATGATMYAACRYVRARGAAQIVVAVPVAPSGWEDRLVDVADDQVATVVSTDFLSIGEWYDDFGQLEDETVLGHLGRGTDEVLPSTDQIEIPFDSFALPGTLIVPPQAIGLVVFAHGSGSSHQSPRNRHVAQRLVGSRLGVLLFDLLTTDEGLDRHCVFDIELLASRLSGAIRWVRSLRGLARVPIGLFGASTGAAAALTAAAHAESDIAAVVSRGGRPDLAAGHLSAVRSPTLLIVGGDDPLVLDLNQGAKELLGGESSLTVIAGAGHLFEEPGALDQVVDAAAAWFRRHLSGPAPVPHSAEPSYLQERGQAGVEEAAGRDSESLTLAIHESAEGQSYYDDPDLVIGLEELRSGERDHESLEFTPLDERGEPYDRRQPDRR